MVTEQPESKLTYQQILEKLDELYEKKEQLELQLSHVNYDIELLQTMIMYKYNKDYDKKKAVRECGSSPKL